MKKLGDDEIYEIPLYIPLDKSLKETKDIVDKLFYSDEELMISINQDYWFEDYGLTFSVDYYGKDHKKLMKLIEDCGIEIDKEVLMDMVE